MLSRLFYVFTDLHSFRNRIDRLPGQKVYVAAVALYAFSRGLRGALGGNRGSLAMLCVLALITLCTSVFFTIGQVTARGDKRLSLHRELCYRILYVS